MHYADVHPNVITRPAYFSVRADKSFENEAFITKPYILIDQLIHELRCVNM